jgi:hypothetical protein
VAFPVFLHLQLCEWESECVFDNCLFLCASLHVCVCVFMLVSMCQCAVLPLFASLQHSQYHYHPLTALWMLSCSLALHLSPSVSLAHMWTHARAYIHANVRTSTRTHANVRTHTVSTRVHTQTHTHFLYLLRLICNFSVCVCVCVCVQRSTLLDSANPAWSIWWDLTTAWWTTSSTEVSPTIPTP